MSESGWLRLLAKAGICVPSSADLGASPQPIAAKNHPADSLLLEAAHDLRQPMQALSLYIASLEAHNLPPDVKTIACGLAGSAAQLASQLNNLIDLAKLREGTIEISSQTLALGPVIADLVADRLVCAHAHDIHLRAMPTRQTAYVDARQLERLLGLLLDLAMQGAKDGVVIGCRQNDAWCLVQAHVRGALPNPAGVAWHLLLELAQLVGGRARFIARSAGGVWELALPVR